MNKLYLIRHGECQSEFTEETEHILTNEQNVLTKKGIEEIKKVGLFLNNEVKVENTTIYSSPIERAKETVNIIVDVIGGEIVFDKQFEERHFNFNVPITSLECRNIQEQLVANPKKSINGFESVYDHRNRVKMGFESIDFSLKKDILIVAHGGTIEQLFGIIQNSPFDNCNHYFTRLDYGCFHKFSYFFNPSINPDGAIFRLDKINEKVFD